MKNIAIITARGGSKRIPRKNIKLFCGKPIIAYAIEAAKASELFDEIMVSTDDEEIASISIKYGAKVPFYRSTRNSDDFATTADVLLEVFETYKELGISFENLCCLYPTTPLLNEMLLQQSYIEFKNGGYDSLIPIVEYNVPIQIALKKNNSGQVEMLNPEFITIRTQDMEKNYFDPGQFYWSKVDSFLNSKNLFTNNTGAYLMDEINVQDIDSLYDWELAEFKYYYLKNKKNG